MTEAHELNSKPIYLKLIEIANGESPTKYALTMKELHELFKRQAEVDNSEDQPQLLSNCVFEVTAEGLYIFTPYTVSSLDDPGNRVGLAIEGIVRNGDDGKLSDKEPSAIYTDKDTRLRIFKAFEAEGSLPVKAYLTAMIENALEYKVKIPNMSIEGEKLVLEIEKGG